MSFKTVVSSLPYIRQRSGIRVSRGRRSAAILVCIIGTLAHAQNPMSEYAVEAAYLFNFGKFVRLTSDASAHPQTFDICIVGEDPLGRTLDDLTANEQLDSKPVRIIRLKGAVEARGCAITYIHASQANRITADLDGLKGYPVLTVSDAATFLQDGGMIQFVIVNNHVRFAVNLAAVRAAQLTLSSELLRVATTVNGEIPPAVQP